jgi:hypothetical protein
VSTIYYAYAPEQNPASGRDLAAICESWGMLWDTAFLLSVLLEKTGVAAKSQNILEREENHAEDPIRYHHLKLFFLLPVTLHQTLSVGQSEQSNVAMEAGQNKQILLHFRLHLPVHRKARSDAIVGQAKAQWCRRLRFNPWLLPFFPN